MLLELAKPFAHHGETQAIDLVMQRAPAGGKPTHYARRDGTPYPNAPRRAKKA